jgi:hypothetical protein
MARGRSAVDVVTIMQIVVAAFLITLGLMAIINYSSDVARLGRGMNRMFGRGNDLLNLAVAIVEIVAGVIVFAGVFFAVQSRLLYGATLVIAILWIIQIILSFFASGFAEPDLVIWINRLAADLIVLLALWLINRKYA